MIKLNLDDEEGDMASKEKGTSAGTTGSGVVGSDTKQKSTFNI